MLKKLCKHFVWIVTLAPMAVFADTSLCANQPTQTVLTQCQSSSDACTSFIKNNCYTSGAGATLQLAQIHGSLAQQYAMQVQTGGGVNAAAPVAPQVQAQPAALPASSVKQQTKSVAVAVAQKPTTTKSKPNYWF
jgi:deoxyribose-phosphate aldolase